MSRPDSAVYGGRMIKAVIGLLYGYMYLLIFITDLSKQPVSAAFLYYKARQAYAQTGKRACLDARIFADKTV